MPIQLTKDLSQSLTEDIIQVLSQLKPNPIKTLVQFLALDLSKLKAISKTNHIEFQRLLNIKTELNDKFSPKPENGLDLYEKQMNNKIDLKTGIERLDQMLISGIHCGQITEITGYTCCGKSQFCHTISAYTVSETKFDVLYIDTDLCFDHLRSSEILQNRFPELETPSRQTLMTRINVVQVLDIVKLINIIESIYYDLNVNPINSEFNKTKLIVIDSLSTPLSLATKDLFYKASEDEREGNNAKAISRKCEAVTLISQVINSLNLLAKRHSIAIVVVNSSSLSLKKNWKNYCELSLLIEDPTHGRGCFRTISISQTSRTGIKIKSYDKFLIEKPGFVSIEPDMY